MIEVEEISTVLDANALLIKAGVVSHILEDSYVIDAGKNAKYHYSHYYIVEQQKKTQSYIDLI